MFRKLVCVIAILSLCVSFTLPAYADVRDDEIRDLKAIVQESLKRIEALEQEQFKTKEDVKEIVQEEAEKAVGKASELPKWVQKMKLKGDVRVRNEQIWNEPGNNQTRQRVRLRVGVEADVTDKVKAGARFVSGGEGVTSTNQTLDDSFEHKFLAFDLAYIEFSPYQWITLDAGMFKNPYYRTDDLIWDSDVTFQGAAGTVKTDLASIGLENTDVFATFGAYPLDDIAGTHDPWLMAGQAGLKSKLLENVKLGIAGAYYDFAQIQGAVLPHRENDNTNIGGNNTAFANDYNCVGVNGELEFEDVISLGECQSPVTINSNNMPIAFFGDYVNNTAVSSEDSGWLAGGRIGPKKIKKKGQWHAKYNYRLLERDAFVDIFPDGDPQSGGTNLRAHEVIVNYGLLDNVMLGFDYYRTREDSGTANAQDIIEADVVVTF